MIELSPDNAVEYLRSHNWVGSGPVRVELLAGGVSNAVLRVETSERTFVLKQSCPQLRTRDAWFSDLDRIYREQEVMQVLHPLLPPGVVPEVLFSDRDNFVFAMSHAPRESRNWKEMLLAGEIDSALGEQAGTILGRMHETTARGDTLKERFGDRNVYIQLRIDPFYRKVQERRPEFAGAIEPIVQRMLTARESLCHGDFTPKNLLVHSAGFTLVDYETAHLGDPTMDLGLFLTHVLLKAVRRPRLREQYFEVTRRFWQGYGRQVQYRPLEDLQAHGIEHLAACMLARIDGTSPVDYLPEEPKRIFVRKLAGAILRHGPYRWRDLLACVEMEFMAAPFVTQGDID